MKPSITQPGDHQRLSITRQKTDDDEQPWYWNWPKRMTWKKSLHTYKTLMLRCLNSPSLSRMSPVRLLKKVRSFGRPRRCDQSPLRERSMHELLFEPPPNEGSLRRICQRRTDPSKQRSMQRWAYVRHQAVAQTVIADAQEHKKTF